MKHVENIQMAKFKTPIAKEWDFMKVWILKRIKRFVWKKGVLEGKTLLSSNISCILQVIAHNMKKSRKKLVAWPQLKL